jgi:hypothetical protein
VSGWHSVLTSTLFSGFNPSESFSVSS